MDFYGGKKFIKLSHLPANFTKTSKFLSYILHKYCSLAFNLAAWLIIFGIAVSRNSLNLLKSLVVLSILRNYSFKWRLKYFRIHIFGGCSIQTMENGNESCLSLRLEVNLLSKILMSRSKNDDSKVGVFSFSK